MKTGPLSTTVQQRKILVRARVTSARVGAMGSSRTSPPKRSLWGTLAKACCARKNLSTVEDLERPSKAIGWPAFQGIAQTARPSESVSSHAPGTRVMPPGRCRHLLPPPVTLANDLALFAGRFTNVDDGSLARPGRRDRQEPGGEEHDEDWSPSGSTEKARQKKVWGSGVLGLVALPGDMIVVRLKSTNQRAYPLRYSHV